MINCHAPKKKIDKKEQARLHYQLGRNSFERNDYISALRELRQSVEIEPNDPDAQYWLGTTYLILEHYSEAETHLKNAIKLRKDYTDAYNTLGTVYIKTGRFDEAIAQFDLCLGDILYQASYPMIYANMGIAYMKKGDLKKAEESFRQAIKLNSKYCPARQYFGEFLSNTNRKDEAILEYENIIQLCPDSQYSWKAHLNLGIELNALGRKEEACQHFSQAQKGDPNSDISIKAAEYWRLLKCR
jgi:Tfp pilus assembly protein PilF